MNIGIVALLLLVLYIMTMNCNEGYINKPPKNRPDDTQFYACHDYNSDLNLGNNNYHIVNHLIAEPTSGVYSEFLNTYNIRNYDELFHSPICEKKISFENISELEIPYILDDEDNSDKQIRDEMLKKEDDFNKRYIKDPFHKYTHHKHIGNKITYSDELNKLFLRNHRSHDNENLQHRMDLQVYSK